MTIQLSITEGIHIQHHAQQLKYIPTRNGLDDNCEQSHHSRNRSFYRTIGWIFLVLTLSST